MILKDVFLCFRPGALGTGADETMNITGTMVIDDDHRMRSCRRVLYPVVHVNIVARKHRVGDRV